MAKDFRHYTSQTHPKPGEMWAWAGAGGTRNYNLLTQDGRQTHGAKPGRAPVAHVNPFRRPPRAQTEWLHRNGGCRLGCGCAPWPGP